MPRSPLPALIASVIALSSAPLAQTPSFRVGEPLPHIHMPDVRTGEPVDLDAFRGKKILIAEFASW